MSNIEPDSPPVALITACVLAAVLVAASLTLYVIALITGVPALTLLNTAGEQVATTIRAIWETPWRLADWVRSWT